MIRVAASAAGLMAIALTVGTAPTAKAAGQYVRTESGLVRCLIMANDQGHGGGPAVACEHGPGFPQAPMSPSGTHFDLAVVNGSGAFRWDDGNIGGGGQPQNDTVLNYDQAFHIQGWTIQPSSDGTRFTNDGTSHGMFVSVENVSPF